MFIANKYAHKAFKAQKSNEYQNELIKDLQKKREEHHIEKLTSLLVDKETKIGDLQKLIKTREEEIGLLQRGNQNLVKDKSLTECRLRREKLKVKQLKQKRASNKDKLVIVEEFLRALNYTDAQISCYLRPGYTSARWGDEDMTMALTLKTISPKAFEYIRKKRLIPLPCQVTLRKYFRDFKVTEGYQDSIHKLPEIRAKDFKESDRIVKLVFDDVHLRRDISYCPTEDRIIGPHRQANTLLLESIVCNFRTPIW